MHNKNARSISLVWFFNHFYRVFISMLHTKQIKKRLMISGFTRENTQDISTLYVYPIEINDIILMYFWIEMLEWNITNKINNKYQFIINNEYKNNQIQSISDRRHKNKSVVCIAKNDYVISSIIYKKFYFEIQLIDFAEAHSLEFQIGYVQYPLSDKLIKNPKYFLGRKNECALYISAFNNYMEIYTNCRRIKSLNSEKFASFKKNDKIGIEFNFITKKALVHYNGCCIGVMSDLNNFTQLIPAISLFHKDITIKCSQWKAIQYV
eukprot:80770_1